MGRGCFICGERGHWSRECPLGDGPNVCHRCGGEGHYARDCTVPKGEGKGAGGTACYICGERGHYESECMWRNSERLGGPLVPDYVRREWERRNAAARTTCGGCKLAAQCNEVP